MSGGFDMLTRLRTIRVSLQLKLIIPFIVIVVITIGILLPITNRLIAERVQSEANQRLDQRVDSVVALMESTEDQALLGARFIASELDVQSAIVAGDIEAIASAVAPSQEALDLREVSVYGPDFEEGDLPVYYGGPVTIRRFQASEEADLIRAELIDAVITSRLPESRIILVPQGAQIVGAAPVQSMGEGAITGVVLTSGSG